MCVAMHPASFDQQGTSVIFSLSKGVEGEVRHSIVYQNAPASHQTGPNAMLLLLPACPMSPEDVLDTTNTPKIAQDCVNAVRPPEPVTRGMRSGPIAKSAAFHVFERGIYTVVLANNSGSILEALELVPVNKRPTPNSKILQWLNSLRSDWPILLACFDNRQAQLATPIFTSYEPLNHRLASLPALDAHHGVPEQLGALVPVNHWAIFGVNFEQLGGHSPEMLANAMRYMKKVNYRDDLPPLHRALLPTHVFGKKFKGRMPNGDFLLPITSLSHGSADDIIRGLV